MLGLMVAITSWLVIWLGLEFIMKENSIAGIIAIAVFLSPVGLFVQLNHNYQTQEVGVERGSDVDKTNG